MLFIISGKAKDEIMFVKKFMMMFVSGINTAALKPLPPKTIIASARIIPSIAIGTPGQGLTSLSPNLSINFRFSLVWLRHFFVICSERSQISFAVCGAVLGQDLHLEQLPVQAELSVFITSTTAFLSSSKPCCLTATVSITFAPSSFSSTEVAMLMPLRFAISIKLREKTTGIS